MALTNYAFNLHTSMHFGKNCVNENADIFKSLGKRTVVFTSKFYDGYENVALADMKEVLDGCGIEYMVIDECKCDPPVESVKELSIKAAGFKPDFLIAVGGGSVMDTCKGAALLMMQPDVDPYEVFWGLGHRSTALKSEQDIPLVGVPTTAGTGSDSTPYAVLTRADINNKETIYPKVYFDTVFLDSRYVENSPAFLIHTGVIDALAHGVEAWTNRKATTMVKMCAEFGFELFRGFKDNLINGTLTSEDYDNMLLCAYIQGIAFPNSGTTLPHGMGYPLSHFKFVNHGLSNGIFLGEYVKCFKDQSLVQPVVEKCGFKDSSEFADFCKKITENDVNIEVTEEELQEWTDSFMHWKHRLANHPEPVDREDIYVLYRKSLSRYIK